MKINRIGLYNSWKSWSFGIHVFSNRFGTLILVFGTAPWTVSWSSGVGKAGRYVLGATFGPVILGIAR